MNTRLTTPRPEHLRSAISRDVDSRDESFEKRRRPRGPVPNGTFTREFETNACRCPGESRTTRRSPARSENDQRRSRLLRGTSESKPGLRRREHAATLLFAGPPLFLRPSRILPLACSPAKFVSYPRRVEQYQREPSGRQEDLGGRKGGHHIGRSYPEKPMECDTGRTCTRGIEGIGDVDPRGESGRIFASRDFGEEALREARRSRRAPAHQFRETPPRNSTSEKVVDLRIPGGEASTFPLPLRDLRHVSAPESARELREEIFYAKLRGGLHLSTFAFSSPLGQGGLVSEPPLRQPVSF